MSRTEISKIFADTIAECERSGIYWDFYEDSPTAVADSEKTIPARLLTHFYRSCEAIGGDVDMAVGLLIAFAARRSVVCWYLYCESDLPMNIVKETIAYWMSPNVAKKGLNPSFFQPCVPYNNGAAIVDCRYTNTASASSAVANAAKFTSTHARIDAITALSDAHASFEVSPIGRCEPIEARLDEVAAVCALDQREMTFEEQYSMADFAFSDQFLLPNER